jgi:hypothetical protein
VSKPLKGRWQGYSKGDDADADTVRALFVRRYCHEPAEVHDAGGCWLAGPIGVGVGGQGADGFDGLAAVGDLDIMAEQLEVWARST